MSTVRLVADLNDMIIDKFIHDYPTFRRFLLTIGNDREQIAHYINKYLKKFITEAYIKSFSPENNRICVQDDYEFHIRRTPFGISDKTIVVFNTLADIPFIDDITHISFPFGAKTLEKLKSYSYVENVEIMGRIEITPDEFVRTFPNIRTIKSENTIFINNVLMLCTTIKKIIFCGYYELFTLISDMRNKIEITVMYERISYLAHLKTIRKKNIKNFKFTVKDISSAICGFDPEGLKIESLDIIITPESTSPLVIPQCYKDLRFLSILTYKDKCTNIDIVIDGFPILEHINIYTINKKRATCRIANVPYIFCLNIASVYELDIDHETVSIFEHRN